MTKTKTNVLGGAKRSGHHKPRGFMPDWRPHADTRKLLDDVEHVLDDYRAYLPMTVRQVFYRLIGAYGYPKDDSAYAVLSETLNKARRAGLIDWDAIRDDGGQYSMAALGYADADAFMASLRRRAANFRLDRQDGQTTKLVLACEAAGMVPQLEAVANDYGVPVITGGGFDSTTRRYELARAIVDEGRPVEVLHIGDHDFHGGHLFIVLDEDVAALVDGIAEEEMTMTLEVVMAEVTLTRLAVTPTQIRELGLTTQPPKLRPAKSAAAIRLNKSLLAFGKTCQAEAIAPPDLANIVRTAIVERLDEDALADILKREKRDRAALIKRLK